MRILCVGTDFPPAGNGGYETQCAGFVAHARAAGHDVRVLCGAGPGKRLAGVHRELARFPAVPEPTLFAIARSLDRWNGAVLARHLRSFAPLAVCWWRLGELSMSLVARAGRPAVGVVCDPWMIDGPRRDPWARMTGAGPDLGAVRWLFASRALRDRVQAAGVAVDGPVVHPGIDPIAAAPTRPWRGDLLYVGRLSPLKGSDVALRAVARLPEARLRVVGGGGRIAAADRVTVEAPKPHAEMAAIYAAADAVLFPSLWEEPFGLVPLEAMAAGRPVIATGTGGSAEYLRPDRNALVVPPGDSDALAAAVRRLAGDPALRARLVAEGRRTAAAFPAARSHAAVLAALGEDREEPGACPASPAVPEAPPGNGRPGAGRHRPVTR
jgi:glycosyltransferase involved in cell wall biosynthesis